MKKIILSLSVLVLTASVSIAQDKKVVTKTTKTVTATDNLKFKEEVHDFGTIPQNKPVTNEFTFKNTGKEPILIQNVHASCGCTAADYTKEPILPGKTGMVKATYNAAAASPFSKTITVTGVSGKATGDAAKDKTFTKVLKLV